MIWASRGRRLPLTLALLAGILVVGVILARTHGPQPEAGATYTGTVYVENAAGRITQRLPITFAVSRSGQRVSSVGFPAGLPHACPAPGALAATATAVSTPIRHPGRFELALAITGAGRRVGTLELSGLFHSLRRETGAVATRYPSARLHGCDASGGYTTRAPS